MYKKSDFKKGQVCYVVRVSPIMNYVLDYSVIEEWKVTSVSNARVYARPVSDNSILINMAYTYNSDISFDLTSNRDQTGIYQDFQFYPGVMLFTDLKELQVCHEIESLIKYFMNIGSKLEDFTLEQLRNARKALETPTEE